MPHSPASSEDPEARFLKVPDVVQCPQVALYIGADFQDLLVFEDFDDGFVERNLAEPEQEALFRRGELQQCDPIDDARPERRPGFGVEPDDGLCRQVAAGLLSLGSESTTTIGPRNSMAGSRAASSLLMLF